VIKPKLIYAFFILSYVSALAASLADLTVLGMGLGAPALLISGWSFLGHFVTLDDDMPGEWSNPEGSRKTWYLSLGELSLKAVIFLVLVVVVYLS
jgi:hypothetical protein